MDGQQDSPCALQNFLPFKAVAQLPLNFSHKPLLQGTGTAGFGLPLSGKNSPKKETRFDWDLLKDTLVYTLQWGFVGDLP